MKKGLIAVLLAVTASAFGQLPGTSRVGQIWSALQERLTRQSDMWFKDGDYPRTIQLLRFQYALVPSNYDIGTNLGFMLENVGEDSLALEVYIELRDASPDEPDNWWPEAFFYYKKKAYAKVPPILEPTIKGHDPHANNYRTLAEAYEKMNMFADAKRVWDIYLTRHPDDLAGVAHRKRIIDKLNGAKGG
ncbi:MAG TPA: hypothetical protein VMI31_08325 [Fimbriimonadaceae bacterium]|nr:hypothetical protein [Fimbriimonadaceae bacterium]